MYQIAYIGRWETLPETAAAICDHDTLKLEVLLQGGLNLNAPIQLSEYIKLTPLEIAVFRDDVPMIHFLLEHGADSDLAEEQPLLLTAARCCGPEVVALFAGQAAKLSPKQKERAFQEVRWGKRPENIPVLELGYSVDYEDEKEDFEPDEADTVELVNGERMPWEQIKRDGIDYIALYYVNEKGSQVQILDAELA